MTVIINMMGGPGSGKSTTATGVFSRLKQRDVSCELVTEYAKDAVWNGAEAMLQNQLHVFAQQFHRQWRLLNKVDFVVTDSPILLSAIYLIWGNEQSPTKFFSPDYIDRMEAFMRDTFRQFDNMNFYINRTKKYQKIGRLQTENEARGIDDLTLNYLHNYNYPFVETDSHRAIPFIISRLESLYPDKVPKDYVESV